MTLLHSGRPYIKSIEIVVVGDSCTGKTSLITTLVSGIFTEPVPQVLQQVLVPPQETADFIALRITDTSSAPDDLKLTMKQVAFANVVIILYALNIPESIDSVLNFWMPEIVKTGFEGPIIIIGNKKDLKSTTGLKETTINSSNSFEGKNFGTKNKVNLNIATNSRDRLSSASYYRSYQYSTNSFEQSSSQELESKSWDENLSSKLSCLLNKYRQIDAIWESSAKLNINVSEIFLIAQQAVIYPISPIFDVETKNLRPKFVTALKRIFRIFDKDCDGLLSDSELNDYQEVCFGARLQQVDIDHIKIILNTSGPGFVKDSNGITFDGFLSVHKKFIECHRTETNWLVLRKFGYDDSLKLRIPLNALYIPSKKNNNDPFDCSIRDFSVELSECALNFFSNLFKQFDENHDGVLNDLELSNLFSVLPGCVGPWTISAIISSTSTTNRKNSPTNGNIKTRVHTFNQYNSLDKHYDRKSEKCTPMKKNNPEFEYHPEISSQVDSKGMVDAIDTLFDLNLGIKNSYFSYLGDFPAGIETNDQGYITLDGWLAEWSLITLLQPRLTLIYLYFLGFNQIKEALVCTRKRSIEDKENNLARNVVRGFVFGTDGVGKSSLLDALVVVNKENFKTCETLNTHYNQTQVSKLNTTQSEGMQHKSTCRSTISLVNIPNALYLENKRNNDSRKKKFCLTETHIDPVEDKISDSMVDCDIAILMFDIRNISSVDWLRRLQKAIPESVPCVYLCNKIDLINHNHHPSQALKEAIELCNENSLPLPELLSLNPTSQNFKEKTNRIFELLLSAASQPDVARSISPERRRKQYQNRIIKATLRISLVQFCSHFFRFSFMVLVSVYSHQSLKATNNN